jgi:hypothetical protein
MRLINLYELPETTQVAVDETNYSYGIRLPRVSYLTMVGDSTAADREIEARECQPSSMFTTADTDWGEQDSLDNIPRKTMPTWIKALHLKGDE